MTYVRQEDWDQLAKQKYNEETNNHPTIHTNRFPLWEELSEEVKNKYRDMVLLRD